MATLTIGNKKKANSISIRWYGKLPLSGYEMQYPIEVIKIGEDNFSEMYWQKKVGGVWQDIKAVEEDIYTAAFIVGENAFRIRYKNNYNESKFSPEVKYQRVAEPPVPLQPSYNVPLSGSCQMYPPAMKKCAYTKSFKLSDIIGVGEGTFTLMNVTETNPSPYNNVSFIGYIDGMSVNDTFEVQIDWDWYFHENPTPETDATAVLHYYTEAGTETVSSLTFKIT